MVFASSRREVVRINTKFCKSGGEVEYKKFCIDPEITSYNALIGLIGKCFSIDAELIINYIATDDYGEQFYLPIQSDWDLDAAILTASDPSLRIQVTTINKEEGFDDWDIVTTTEVHSHQPRAGKPIATSPPASSLSSSSTASNGFRGAGAPFAQSSVHAPPRLTSSSSLFSSLSQQFERTFSTVQKAIGFKGEAENHLSQPIKAPMSDSEFRRFMDCSGRIIQMSEFKRSVYMGGLEPCLRKVAWRLLLNVYPAEMTGKERIALLESKSLQYTDMRDAWKKAYLEARLIEEQLASLALVSVDVVRTDRSHNCFAGDKGKVRQCELFNILATYCLYHPAIGYHQGMSDMASALLYVQQDEAAAYVCFCALMSRLGASFVDHDQLRLISQMQHLHDLVVYMDPGLASHLRRNNLANMYFAQRWLLLEMKREFPLDEALRVLEVQWAALPNSALRGTTIDRPSTTAVSSGQLHLPISNGNTDKSSGDGCTSDPYVGQTNGHSIVAIMANCGEGIVGCGNSISSGSGGHLCLAEPSAVNLFTVPLKESSGYEPRVPKPPSRVPCYAVRDVGLIESLIGEDAAKRSQMSRPSAIEINKTMLQQMPVGFHIKHLKNIQPTAVDNEEVTTTPDQVFLSSSPGNEAGSSFPQDDDGSVWSATLSRASQRRNLIASQQRLQRCRDISSLRRRQHQQQTGQRLPSDLRRPENGMKDWTHWHESRIMNESDCVTAPLLNQSRRLSCSSRSDSFSSTSNQPLLSPHSSHASQSIVGSSGFSLGRAPPLLRQVERHSAIPRSLSERASLANRSPENFAFGPNEDVEYGEEVVGEVWGDAFASLEPTTLVCESHRQDIETESSANQAPVSFGHLPQVYESSTFGRRTRLSSSASLDSSPPVVQLKDCVVELPPPDQLGYGQPFLLFLCLAMLLEYREEIVLSVHEVCDLVHFYQRMSKRHNTLRLLNRARKMYDRYLAVHEAKRRQLIENPN